MKHTTPKKSATCSLLNMRQDATKHKKNNLLHQAPKTLPQKTEVQTKERSHAAALHDEEIL